MSKETIKVEIEISVNPSRDCCELDCPQLHKGSRGSYYCKSFSRHLFLIMDDKIERCEECHAIENLRDRMIKFKERGQAI